MNFVHSIHPLTDFLTENNFAITKEEHHFIEYSKNSTVITIAYDNLEHAFYVHVGQSSKSLIELTPIVIKEIFGQDDLQFQATLTVDNLISFLKNTGREIILGNEKIFDKLEEFSSQRSKEFTKQVTQLQNTLCADNAWKQKDYSAFVKHIDRTEKGLLPESYLKKYKIALDKLKRKNE
jgi:hypothetical protein